MPCSPKCVYTHPYSKCVSPQCVYTHHCSKCADTHQYRNISTKLFHRIANLEWYGLGCVIKVLRIRTCNPAFASARTMGCWDRFSELSFFLSCLIIFLNIAPLLVNFNVVFWRLWANCLCWLLFKSLQCSLNWHSKEYIDTLQRPRICRTIDYHILLGMLDLSYKRIIRVKFSHPIVLLT